MKGLLRSFGYAFRGIGFCIVHERNMRIHLTAICYVTAFSLFFPLSRGEYAVLLLCFGLVPALEAVNTAVEKAVDLRSPARHPLARVAKDAAAGAVLIASLAAVGAAVFLFARPEGFQNLFLFFVAFPWAVIPLAAVTALFVLFIFRGPFGVLSFLRHPGKKDGVTSSSGRDRLD